MALILHYELMWCKSFQTRLSSVPYADHEIRLWHLPRQREGPFGQAWKYGENLWRKPWKHGKQWKTHTFDHLGIHDHFEMTLPECHVIIWPQRLCLEDGLPPSVFPHFDPKLLHKMSLRQEHLWNHWNQMKKHHLCKLFKWRSNKKKQCLWFRNWMFIVVTWMLSSAIMVTSISNQPRNWQTTTKQEEPVPSQSTYLCHNLCHRVLLWLQRCRCCGRCLSSLWVWFLLSHCVYWQKLNLP